MATKRKATPAHDEGWPHLWRDALSTIDRLQAENRELRHKNYELLTARIDRVLETPVQSPF